MRGLFEEFQGSEDIRQTGLHATWSRDGCGMPVLFQDKCNRLAAGWIITTGCYGGKAGSKLGYRKFLHSSPMLHELRSSPSSRSWPRRLDGWKSFTMLFGWNNPRRRTR